MMVIKLKAMHNGIEIEVEAEIASEALKEFDNAIELIDKKEIKLQSVKPTTGIELSPPSNGEIPDEKHREYFSDIIRFDENGPKILFRIEGGQVNSQKEAFMTIAYILDKFYNEKDISSSRVSSLMEKSGLNTKNIHNATASLTKKHYITKAKRQQKFQLTTLGENYVIKLLESEKNKLEVENQ